MAAFETLHWRTFEALKMLSDSDLSVTLPIMEGRAPGTWDLMQSLIPPRNVHRDDVAARFMVSVSELRGIEIQLMVSLLEEDNGPTFVYGFIAHHQSAKWHLDPKKLYAAACYNRNRRQGKFIVTREVHNMLLEETKD